MRRIPVGEQSDRFDLERGTPFGSYAFVSRLLRVALGTLKASIEAEE